VAIARSAEDTSNVEAVIGEEEAAETAEETTTDPSGASTEQPAE
jgi:DNA gyrase subunit A